MDTEGNAILKACQSLDRVYGGVPQGGETTLEGLLSRVEALCLAGGAPVQLRVDAELLVQSILQRSAFDFTTPTPAPRGGVLEDVAHALEVMRSELHDSAVSTQNVVDAIEALPQPALVIHRDGAVALSNPMAVKLLGHRCARGARLAGAFVDPKEVVRALARASSSSQPVKWTAQLHGSETHIAWSLAPLSSHFGDISAFLCVGIDVTDFVAARRAMEASQQLAETQARSKTRLLRQLSHSLRTPLNGIMGVAQLLEETSLDDDQRELLQELNRSATQLMEQILNLDVWGRDLEEPHALRLVVPGSRGSDVPAPRRDNKARTRSGGASTYVLVVEDEPLNRRIAQRLLASLGCEVDLAEDGEQAVECACARSYDLVLMDLRMPILDGLEATRRIRALPEPECFVPIVALTAHAFEEERTRCAAVGMNGFLAKPVRRKQLAAALARHARGAKRRV